jgi:hypothetical protein
MNLILAGTIFAVVLFAGILLLLPALNVMFDITTTRTEAAKLHPPADYLRNARCADSRVFVVRGLRHGDTTSSECVALIAFAVVLSVTAYVIIDLEYPRLGFIQVSDSDQVLVDLRRSMNFNLNR